MQGLYLLFVHYWCRAMPGQPSNSDFSEHNDAHNRYYKAYAGNKYDGKLDATIIGFGFGHWPANCIGHNCTVVTRDQECPNS